MRPGNKPEVAVILDEPGELDVLFTYFRRGYAPSPEGQGAYQALESRLQQEREIFQTTTAGVEGILFPVAVSTWRRGAELEIHDDETPIAMDAVDRILKERKLFRRVADRFTERFDTAQRMKEDRILGNLGRAA